MMDLGSSDPALRGGERAEPTAATRQHEHERTTSEHGAVSTVAQLHAHLHQGVAQLASHVSAAAARGRRGG